MKISFAHAAKAFVLYSSHGCLFLHDALRVACEQAMSVRLFVLSFRPRSQTCRLANPTAAGWRWSALNISKNEMAAPSKTACCLPSGFLFG